MSRLRGLALLLVAALVLSACSIGGAHKGGAAKGGSQGDAGAPTSKAAPSSAGPAPGPAAGAKPVTGHFLTEDDDPALAHLPYWNNLADPVVTWLDNQTLVYASRSGIELVDAKTLEPRTVPVKAYTAVADAARRRIAYWGPDGLFVWSEKAGSQQLLSTGQLRELAHVPPDIHDAGDYLWVGSLSWSPGGMLLAVPARVIEGESAAAVTSRVIAIDPASGKVNSLVDWEEDRDGPGGASAFWLSDSEVLVTEPQYYGVDSNSYYADLGLDETISLTELCSVLTTSGEKVSEYRLPFYYDPYTVLDGQLVAGVWSYPKGADRRTVMLDARSGKVLQRQPVGEWPLSTGAGGHFAVQFALSVPDTPMWGTQEQLIWQTGNGPRLLREEALPWASLYLSDGWLSPDGSQLAILTNKTSETFGVAVIDRPADPTALPPVTLPEAVIEAGVAVSPAPLPINGGLRGALHYQGKAAYRQETLSKLTYGGGPGQLPRNVGSLPKLFSLDTSPVADAAGHLLFGNPGASGSPSREKKGNLYIVKSPAGDEFFLNSLVVGDDKRLVRRAPDGRVDWWDVHLTSQVEGLSLRTFEVLGVDEHGRAYCYRDYAPPDSDSSNLVALTAFVDIVELDSGNVVEVPLARWGESNLVMSLYVDGAGSIYQLVRSQDGAQVIRYTPPSP